MKAIIVGGGIAGLASALALSQRGWRVEVLERAGEFAEVGAGLVLWPNALRALDSLGLGEAVRARARLQGQAGIRRRDGRWLSRTDTAELERRYGHTATIHRADLLGILHSALPGEALRAGVAVSAVRADGTATHAAGESSADLVVGADGARSVTRASVWPGSPAPRYVGYTTWRIITPPVPVGESAESWGAGERFGYLPLPDGRIYCYASVNAPAGSADGGLAGLRRRFGRWHEPIPSLLAAAAPDAVIHRDLYELPALPSYVSGRVALVGDAAHAMTPNLGQGACQALEDAVELAKTLEAGGLDAYDRLRRPRAQMISKRSRQIGVVAQLASPAAVRLRDTALRLLPSSSMVRSLAPVLDWTP